MKVFYPNDGISSKIKPMLNDSLTHLSNAQDYLSMSIPSNFEMYQVLEKILRQLTRQQILMLLKKEID